jgi:retron-type reverse transcriptase
MKRCKNVYPKVTDFRNLLVAAQKAQKGKRKETPTARFNIRIEQEIIKIQQELETQTYIPGAYRSFYIREPKPRMISAAPYRDRVVHHALCNVISPLLEKQMINDTFANRKGKGTHKAILRYQFFAKKYKYVLKCDIAKFFPSIDHEILKEILRKKIGCKKTLALIDLIIDNSNPQEERNVYFEGDDLFTPFERKRGLPIGNLTSQLWGNFYLNDFDHFIKEKLRIKGYVRYVDDFAIFGNSKANLQQVKKEIALFLAKYRLELHAQKSYVYPVNEGLPFLGHRIFPYFRLLKKENVRRAKKRFRSMKKRYLQKRLTWAETANKIQSWLAHAKFSRTYHLRNKIIAYFWDE